MRNLAENIWIFDGQAVPFLCFPFSTRMTVIRLADATLWVHSPIKLTPVIEEQLQQLGKVKYLIAPNHLHHLFLAQWQTCYPEARCYGTDEVIEKRADLSFHGSLNKVTLWPWQNEIEQVLFSGSKMMQECVFFHRTSKVLIVTDLIENFSGKTFNRWQRGIAKIVGILAPNGKMPLDWRLTFLFNKPKARKHMTVIDNWQAKVIVMAHGEIVTLHAQAFLKRAFNWLY